MSDVGRKRQKYVYRRYGRFRSDKVQCNGQRPACARCIEQEVECKYAGAEGETPSSTLKRKFGTMEQELEQLRELLGLIRDRSLQEVHNIVDRLRITVDPLEVLHIVKQADLLLPTPLSDSSNQNPRLARLDQEALDHSPIKVHARPWTLVAGDGIVSELISQFFVSDDFYLFPSLHRESFLEDMNNPNQNMATTRFCSSVLVNAICAQQCASFPGYCDTE